MRKTVICLASVVAAHSLCFRCSAASITIGASKDGTIYSNHVDRGSGGGNGLFIGTNGREDPRRAPIAFDVAGNLPQGATIQDVRLTLVLGQLATEAVEISTIELHRLQADWGEGTTQQQSPPNDSFGGMGQGAPAADGDVTWIARFWGATPTLWATPGGDFASLASASAAVGTPLNVEYSWDSTAALVSDVQGWLDNPATNFGWMLLNVDETSMSTFRVFYSRQTATAEWRPKLSITFDVVPEHDSWILSLLGVLTLTMRRVRPLTS